MKKWQYVIVVILCVSCFCGGMATVWYLFQPAEKIKIVEKFKPVIKYIKIPASCKEYEDCYNSSIALDGKIIDNVFFLASATDGCKKTERKFQLEGKAKIKPNVFIIDYEPALRIDNKIMLDHGAGIAYYRLLFNSSKCNVGVGAGLAANSIEVIFKPGIILQF